MDDQDWLAERFEANPPDGSPFSVMALTVKGGRIVVIDVLADPDRLGQLDLTVVAG